MECYILVSIKILVYDCGTGFNHGWWKIQIYALNSSRIMDLELGEYAVEYIFQLGFKDVALYVVYVMYYYNASTLQIWNSMGLLWGESCNSVAIWFSRAYKSRWPVVIVLHAVLLVHIWFTSKNRWQRQERRCYYRKLFNVNAMY